MTVLPSGLRFLLGLIPAALWAQTTGSLEGRVTDGRTEQPIARAVVSVVGTTIQTRTDTFGRYRIERLASGVVNIRIEHPGFASAVVPAEVEGAAGADFRLFSASTVLDAILVRARSAGDSSRDGAKTTVVSPDQRHPNSVGDLVARVPGAMVISGGQIGSGLSVRLRGLRSILARGNPMMYLDGVLVSGGGGEPRSGKTGIRYYSQPTIIDQLDPASIDRIEVLPGAAATALYGTGAADGVILIYTKR